jgi:hypothetical protein
MLPASTCCWFSAPAAQQKFCRKSAFAVPCAQLKTLKESFFKTCPAAGVKVISEYHLSAAVPWSRSCLVQVQLCKLLQPIPTGQCLLHSSWPDQLLECMVWAIDHSKSQA